MTVYSAGTNPASPLVLISLGILAFVASMIETLLDCIFPPDEINKG
jgi:hypothetical protein